MSCPVTKIKGGEIIGIFEEDPATAKRGRKPKDSEPKDEE